MPATQDAVIEFAHAPVVALGDLLVRLDTLLVALLVLGTLAITARIARSTPLDPERPVDAPVDDDPDDRNHLRADDLLYIAVAAFPGAVVGGRLGQVLVHRDYYLANPGHLFDPAQGALTLSLAVVGGFATGGLVALLLGAPLGRWMHAVTLPLLGLLAGGRIAAAVGGAGQGRPWDGPFATAYTGPGPWGSLAPAIPSHPAQLYETIAVTGVLVAMALLVARGTFANRDGAALLVGIGLWALVRVAVAATWRDPVVVGPFRVAQVVDLLLAGACGWLIALAALAGESRRRRSGVRSTVRYVATQRRRGPERRPWDRAPIAWSDDPGTPPGRRDG